MRSARDVKITRLRRQIDLPLLFPSIRVIRVIRWALRTLVIFGHHVATALWAVSHGGQRRGYI